MMDTSTPSERALKPSNLYTDLVVPTFVFLHSQSKYLGYGNATFCGPNQGTCMRHADPEVSK